MSPTDSELIQKVQDREAELVELYTQVYLALRRVDRNNYDASRLAELDGALDPPGQIEPAKAIAVLKAIMGTTSDDKLKMETFFPAAFDSQTSVGTFVRRRIKDLGLGYHDFWPFLRAKGWVAPKS